MEKATPGPWSAFSESELTIRSGHKIVVDYVSSDYGAYQCVGEDDANLIASAINAMPELLDAYDRFVEVTRERDAAESAPKEQHTNPPPIKLPRVFPAPLDEYNFMFEDEVKQAIEDAGLKWIESL